MKPVLPVLAVSETLNPVCGGGGGVQDLVTVSPYFMKAGVDIGRAMPPDKRKDGPPWGHFVAGGSAGIVSKTLSSPLNVIAIRIATAAADAPIAGALSVIPRAAAQVCAATPVPGATRTMLGFGICPWFKDHSLTPVSTVSQDS